VHDDGLLAAGVPEPDDRRQRQNLDILRKWAAAPSAGGQRRIHLRFLRSPVRLDGTDGRVSSVVAERNTVDGERVRGTGELETLDVGLVVRAIGYRAEPVPGLPFDERNGIVPNEGGRVVRDGVPVPGAYVTGWIKRGPTGVIGTNKSDAAETAAAVLEDLPMLPAPAEPDPAALRATLAEYGIRPVDWTGWLRVDAEEVRRGGQRAAERVKVASLAEMLEHAHGVPAG
jgi:ferredoxin--NADP+ reductase